MAVTCIQVKASGGEERSQIRPKGAMLPSWGFYAFDGDGWHDCGCWCCCCRRFWPGCSLDAPHDMLCLKKNMVRIQNVPTMTKSFPSFGSRRHPWCTQNLAARTSRAKSQCCWFEKCDSNRSIFFHEFHLPINSARKKHHLKEYPVANSRYFRPTKASET